MFEQALTSLTLALFQTPYPGEHRVTDMFRPLGSNAESEKSVAYLSFAVTGAIFVVVAGLIVYTIAKYRRNPNETNRQEPAQVYGSNQIEVAWTVIPVLIVFVLLGVSARVIAALQNESPPERSVKIKVVGHQWWFEAQYPDLGIVTANEIHIPAASQGHRSGAELELTSEDVNHSFWIPQLSGKTDMIPNRLNHMVIDAYQPGVYLGNCSEYCGTQHANMLIRVIADSPADWKRWTDEQRRLAVPAQNQTQAGSMQAGQTRLQTVSQTHSMQPGDQTTTKGDAEGNPNRKTFESLACVNCHMIRGTSAIGKFGPDLTHLMSRRTIASGILENNQQNLRRWIDNPQDEKPGCLMPSFKLTNKELDQVVAYLETLH